MRSPRLCLSSAGSAFSGSKFSGYHFRCSAADTRASCDSSRLVVGCRKKLEFHSKRTGVEPGLALPLSVCHRHGRQSKLPKVLRWREEEIATDKLELKQTVLSHWKGEAHKRTLFSFVRAHFAKSALFFSLFPPPFLVRTFWTMFSCTLWEGEKEQARETDSDLDGLVIEAF